MKVLHISEYIKGGVGTYIREVFGYQKQNKKIDSFLITSEDSRPELKDLGGKITYYKYSRKPLWILISMFKIQYEIMKIKPDIIHIHSTFAGIMARFPLFLVPKSKRPKVIYCAHGWSFLMEGPNWKLKIYEIIERFLSLVTDHIINISFDEHDKSIKKNLPQRKSTVIYNGISSEYENYPVNIKLEKNKINLLFIGRFDKQKGLDILLDFFAKEKFRNLTLYLAGEKVLSKDSVKLPTNVKEIGWIDNKYLYSYLEKFDAVIVPSRWEGFGIVAIEAMKTRTPVIASNRGALPEIVKDGYNGLIFELNNMKTLKDITDNLSKEKLKYLGENGRINFLENYTSEVMNEKILKLYNYIYEK